MKGNEFIESLQKITNDTNEAIAATILNLADIYAPVKIAELSTDEENENVIKLFFDIDKQINGEIFNSLIQFIKKKYPKINATKDVFFENVVIFELICPA